MIRRVIVDTLALEGRKTWQIQSAALTDPGQQRNLNEDAVFHQTGQTYTGENVGLYLVCDGLGGHPAGEVASRLAMEIVVADLRKRLFSLEAAPGNGGARSALRQRIQAAVKKANANLRHYAHTHSQEAENMGTTLALVLIYDDVAHIANVGDSRVYAWRSGQVTQITRDHSLAAELAKMGLIDESEIAHHPRSNVLSRALGTEDHVEVDLFEWELQPGGKLLLCSDGLWRTFTNTAELARWLGSSVTPANLCWQLVIAAKQRDGSDNISAVLVSIEPYPYWQIS